MMEGHVCMLTRSASERSGIACKSKLGEQHKKQLRRCFFIVLINVLCL